METLKDYELIDFGAGRKLERFGTAILDRPCPAAADAAKGPAEIWQQADWRFIKPGDRGKWKRLRRNADSPRLADVVWPLDCGTFSLELRPTPFGHVGVFPEQATNWQRIHRFVSRRASEEMRVLNLFAYTGGSSLAAAAAGAAVVHVDAAKSTVQRARENAAFTGMANAPIRWIVEDARRFVAREMKRGNQYEAIILDPPSYGHGVKGEVWKLTTDLMPLLDDCRRLLSAQPAFVLLTCHSPGFGPAEVGATLQQSMFGHCQGRTATYALDLNTRSGRRLSAGVAALASW